MVVFSTSWLFIVNQHHGMQSPPQTGCALLSVLHLSFEHNTCGFKHTPWRFVCVCHGFHGLAIPDAAGMREREGLFE